MSDTHPVLKKLQFKENGQPVLILQAPPSYREVEAAFGGEVHNSLEEANDHQYEFVQVFGTMNDELSQLAKQAANLVQDDGLLWLCYPKKSSKQYKGSDCSRESLTPMLAEQGYEPVRQIAIDEDWSALRFRKPEHIKKMVRTFATTEEGKKRTES